MKKNNLFLTLLLASTLGFSQEFFLDFEDTDPLSNLPAGVTAVDATAAGTGGATVKVKSGTSNTDFTTETQLANFIEVDPNDAGNKILKMDFQGFVLLDETVLGTGSWSVSGYINGYSLGGNPQYTGFISVTGLDATLSPGVHRIVHRYGNGQMTDLMAIPSSTGFSMLNTVLHHFVFTFDATDNIYRMYRNGDLVGTSTAKAVWTGKKVYLGYKGGSQDGTTAEFTSPAIDVNGNAKDVQLRLDDLSVYKFAFTEQQATTLYSNGTLAVNKITNESFDVYPNPVVDYLNISSNDVSSVEVYNTLGAMVLSKKVSNGVDMSNLNQGVYIVKCKDENNVTLSNVRVVKK